MPAMLGVHALIGLGEAAITVAAVAAVLAVRPDLVALGEWQPMPGVPAGSTAGGVS
jgi:cobalt/nickel transport system permease protein